MTAYNAYVYLVKNKYTGEFYYGYRSANIRLKRKPEEDFWVHYKTSSKNLKAQITSTPERFEWFIVFEGTPEECYWTEQTLIKENFKVKGCLNRHYAEPGSIQFWKASPGSQLGVPKSEEHRAKISAAKTGVPSTISKEAKERRGFAIAKSNSKRKGIPRPDTVKQHLKEIGMSAGAANPRAKTWVIEMICGHRFTMKGIKPWCIENGLVQATLRTTLETGKFYKGYRVLSIT
jgi:hypothetical protein